MTDADSQSARVIPAGIPVVHYDHAQRSDALGHFRRLDEIASLGPIVWNEHGPGFWMVSDYALVKEAYQNPEVFTSDSILAADPNPQHTWLPTMTNGEVHLRYRRLLNETFGPANVARLVPRTREIANTVIDRFIDAGTAEVMTAFCGEVPTAAFLALVGLPIDDARELSLWVADIFDHIHDLDRQPMLVALDRVSTYFRSLIDERRADPERAPDDIVTMLCRATIDGAPLPIDDILNLCNTITMAGLDTTRSQLGHALLHLATNPADRERLRAAPNLWPGAVEEFLRLHAVVSNDARKLGADVDFHGCPMRTGDMAVMSLGPACRDPRQFENPLTFDPSREPNRHLAFAAGPHRCLGSHLARMELLVALEEWHRRIPEYRVAEGGLGPERGSQMSLVSLTLEWESMQPHEGSTLESQL